MENIELIILASIVVIILVWFIVIEAGGKILFGTSKIQYLVKTHPNDIAVLRKQIPELEYLDDEAIARLYNSFSNYRHFIDWRVVGANTLVEFKYWLETRRK